MTKYFYDKDREVVLVGTDDGELECLEATEFETEEETEPEPEPVRRHRRGPSPDSASNRQRAVAYLEKGWTPKEVAEKLGINVASVYAYKSKYLGKGPVKLKKEKPPEDLSDLKDPDEAGISKDDKIGHISAEIQEEIRKMRDEDGKTSLEIANELDLSIGEVNSVLSVARSML